MYSSDEEFWSDEHESYSHFCIMPNRYEERDSGEEYCPKHQQVCQVSNCLRRDSLFRGYCSDHEHKCAKYQCEARVISHRDVCENHLDYHRCDFWTSPALAYRNCKDYFCWKELIINHAKETGRGEQVTYYCPYSGCDLTVGVQGEYCSLHNSCCQGSGCSARISSYDIY